MYSLDYPFYQLTEPSQNFGFSQNFVRMFPATRSPMRKLGAKAIIMCFQTTLVLVLCWREWPSLLVGDSQASYSSIYQPL